MSPVDHPVFDDLKSGTNELVELLQELVRCHPVYGTAGQAAALTLCEQKLADLGFEVRWRTVAVQDLQRSAHYVDVTAFGSDFASYAQLERASLRGRQEFSATGPRIILNGHVDVEFVTSPENWAQPGLWSSGHLVDGLVHGRGTCDMLGGVACYLYTLGKLAPYFGQARGSISVQLVLDEEIGGNGTLSELLDPSRGTADLAIIAEPSDRVVCGRSRGFHQFAITCTGAPVHMVFANAHDNANSALPELLHVLEELNSWILEQAPSDDAGRYVMYGIVEGGTDAAVPADQVQVRVTLALPPDLEATTVEAHLKGQLERRCRSWLRQPEIIPYGLCFEGSSLTHDATRQALLRAGRRRGVHLTEGEFPSACDARLFEAFGIPAVVYGPGSLHRAHSSAEFITVEELSEYCAVLADTLLSLWGTEDNTW